MCMSVLEGEVTHAHTVFPFLQILDEMGGGSPAIYEWQMGPPPSLPLALHHQTVFLYLSVNRWTRRKILGHS